MLYSNELVRSYSTVWGIEVDLKSGWLKHPQNRVGIIFPTGGFRKRRPVLQVERNRFVDNLAQFGEYGSFIIDRRLRRALLALRGLVVLIDA